MRSELIKWMIYMVLFSLIASFVDNAGHLGGFVGGMLVAKIIKLGPSKKHFRFINTLVLSISFFTIAAFTQTLFVGWPYGFSLKKDVQSKSIMGFIKYGPEYPFKESSQFELINRCGEIEKTVFVCKKAFRANPHNTNIARYISAIAPLENNQKDAQFYGWLADQME